MDYIMETVGLRKAYKDNIVVDDVNMHDQKICSCNNRYFFDCYCVTASYYHQKHNQSGVHNASYLSCYCYRHCYTTYL